MRGFAARLTRPIDIVEAAYDLASPDDRWLRRILRSAHADLDCGLGVASYVLSMDRPDLPLASPLVTKDMPAHVRELVARAHDVPPPGTVEFVRGNAVFLGGLKSSLGRGGAAERIEEDGLGDAVCGWVQDGERRVLKLIATAPSSVTIHESSVGAWRRVLFHLGAALRLRRRLARPEALVTPGGRVEHVAPSLQGRSAREGLVAAIARVERARTSRVRRAPDEALDLWSGLVAGRWSIVDHFESDGRRYVACHANVPTASDPRALTRIERNALTYYLRRTPPAEIAFALGRSRATIERALSSAARRLRFPSRAALLRVTEAEVLDRISVGVGGTDLDVLVVKEVVVDPGWDDVLTEVTLDVVRLAAAGLSDAEIAARRGRSTRTVSNQLRAAYADLGVNRRSQLAARLRERPRGV